MNENQKHNDFVKRCIDEGNELIEKEIQAERLKKEREDALLKKKQIEEEKQRIYKEKQEEEERITKKNKALAFVYLYLPKELNPFINVQTLPIYEEPLTIAFNNIPGYCFELQLPKIRRLGVSISYKKLSGNEMEIKYHLPKIFKHSSEHYQLCTGMNDSAVRVYDHMMPKDVPYHGVVDKYKMAIAYAQRVVDMFIELAGDHEELC